MAKALTVKAIDAIKAPPTRKEIPDGGMPGLYLIVQPSGLKSWAIRYRHDGKTRKFTIGSYPAFGLAKAREDASAALRLVSEGKDPASEKGKELDEGAGTSLSFGAALDDFIKRHIEARNRPSTIKEHTRLLEQNVRPLWKDRPVSEIRKKDVVALIDGIVDRGSPIVANRVFAVLRKFFNWALERDLIETSPMGNLKAPSQETSRDRVLTDKEISLFWRATDKLGWPFGPFYKLLLLLGQRREEVAGARWSEFDLDGDNPVWIIPKERAKNNQAHSVALAPSVVEILYSLPRVKGEVDYVFTTNGRTSISGFSRAKSQLDAKMLEIAREGASKAGNAVQEIKLVPWRIHDLRRTCASGLAALGTPIHVIEAILNHRSGTIKGVAAIYNRYDYADEKCASLSKWAEKVGQVL